ncbi:MAG: ABC transporter ATP-binding protein, partial [Planctomycetia bacterium]
MARIQLKNVNLTFRLWRGRHRGIKEVVLDRIRGRKPEPALQVEALNQINLDLRVGDRLGIIGHNGAGKSTLLKLMAGVYPPSSGVRRVEGRISSLFDIALGFESDSTGWENIAYRSYLQGDTPAMVRERMGAIAEFSELGRYMDMPVRYYSSGMAMRLAFSIATAIDPEILLVDEVLAVGDRSFQDKARGRMREMMSKAKLIVIVSHDLSVLPTLCEKVIWMERG